MVDSDGYFESDLAVVGDARGLDVDACFGWDDKGGDSGFWFAQFAFVREQAAPFGFDLDFLSFVFVFDYALSGEEL